MIRNRINNITKMKNGEETKKKKKEKGGLHCKKNISVMLMSQKNRNSKL